MAAVAVLTETAAVRQQELVHRHRMARFVVDLPREIEDELHGELGMSEDRDGADFHRWDLDVETDEVEEHLQRRGIVE
jgi:hypothetical protein